MIRLLLGFFIAGFCLIAVAQEIRHSDEFHNPFWRSKPDVQKRINDEDLVVVSSKVREIKDSKKYSLQIVAGGALNAPLEQTYEEMTKYDKLKEIDKHFEESKYDPAKKVLFIKVSAMGYYADMHLKLNEVTFSSKDKKQVHWECIEGQFKGMKGVIEAKALGPKKTEISMTAKYEAEKIPLPKVLMGFGLEVLGRQVAIKMRDYIKDQYNNR